MAKRLWVNLLGDVPIDVITSDDLNAAKDVLRRLPETHGTSSRETTELRALVDQIKRRETLAVHQAEARLRGAGGSPAQIEAAKLDALTRRIRLETVLKHTRALNRPTKLLLGLGLIASNPFQSHMITTKAEKQMRQQEEDRDRRPWGEKLPDLLATPDGFVTKVSPPMIGQPSCGP